MVAFSVTVTKKKMQDIFSSSQNATTNSLLINFMEHFIGNLILLKESRTLGRSNSIVAHNDRNSYFLYGQMVCNLFDYYIPSYQENPCALIYIEENKPNLDEINKLNELFQYYDKNQIGAAYGNQNGFVYIGYDSHARILNRMLRDDENSTEVTKLELINPWGIMETISIKEILEKENLNLRLYTPHTD